MKKLLAILLVLALSLGMLPMALADEPTVLTSAPSSPSVIWTRMC